MKYYLLLLLAVFTASTAFAQNENPEEPTIKDTVIFRSDPKDSLCNNVFKTEGCAPGAAYINAENMNQTNYPELVAAAWSYNQGSCPRGYTRALINFNGMTAIPQNAVVTKAELKMFGWDNPAISITVGNSYYPGSPYSGSGTNEMLVKRITQPWNIQTLTWNTQPTTSSTSVLTGHSNSQYGDNIVVDVTGLVQDMITNNQFYGFMMMMQTEALYRSYGFHSCFATDSTKRPQLVVTFANANAVTDVIAAEDVKIYPTPTHDNLFVEYIAGLPSDVNYYVYDMKGAKKIEGNAHAAVGANKLQIAVADLPQGVYMFSLTNGSSSVKKRFAKY